MKMLNKSVLILVLSLFGISLLGCQPSDTSLKTVPGLQEQNQVLQEQVADRDSRRSADTVESTKKLEEQKKLHQEQLAKEKDLHSRRLAAKESELSGLRLRLGALERENLALTEIVDNHPVIIDAVADHKRNDVWVFAVLLGVALSLLGLFIWKYRSVSDRLNLLTMKQVGELRRIGGEV